MAESDTTSYLDIMLNNKKEHNSDGSEEVELIRLTVYSTRVFDLESSQASLKLMIALPQISDVGRCI